MILYRMSKDFITYYVVLPSRNCRVLLSPLQINLLQANMALRMPPSNEKHQRCGSSMMVHKFHSYPHTTRRFTAVPSQLPWHDGHRPVVCSAAVVLLSVIFSHSSLLRSGL